MKTIKMLLPYENLTFQWHYIMHALASDNRFSNPTWTDSVKF